MIGEILLKIERGFGMDEIGKNIVVRIRMSFCVFNWSTVDIAIKSQLNCGNCCRDCWRKAILQFGRRENTNWFENGKKVKGVR
jgi:hypothetical protein